MHFNFFAVKISDLLKLHVYGRKLPQHTCKIRAVLLLMIELAILSLVQSDFIAKIL